MKTLTVILLTLALAACSATDYPKSAADVARDNAWDDMTSSAMIANGFRQPVTCMNVGGVVTCN